MLVEGEQLRKAVSWLRDSIDEDIGCAYMEKLMDNEFKSSLPAQG